MTLSLMAFYTQPDQALLADALNFFSSAVIGLPVVFG
jgi:hypothetical protein